LPVFPFNADGKRTFESVGSDPAVAVAKRIERQGYFDYESAGLAVVEPASVKAETSRALVSQLIETYSAEVKATYQAYTNSLRFFEESCSKQYADEIVRTDMLEFRALSRARR
jgi:hypothetical protein